MTIVVEYESDVLGSGVFWQGPEEQINEIHNIPARKTAELVVLDGLTRSCGMWTVRQWPSIDDDEE